MSPSSLSKLAHDAKRGTLTSTEGTRAFWAPEMLADESSERGFSGYASDIWAVGVCLYIFVLGSTPFKGGGDEGVLLCFESIKNDDPCAALDPATVSGPCASLMRALLTKDWQARIPIDQALQHPFVKSAEEHPQVERRETLKSAGKLRVTKSEVKGALGPKRRIKMHGANDCLVC